MVVFFMNKLVTDIITFTNNHKCTFLRLENRNVGEFFIVQYKIDLKHFDN